MNQKFIITGVGVAIAIGITAFVLFAHETNPNINNRNLTSIIPGTTNTEENKSTITQGKHLQISISESVGIKSK